MVGCLVALPLADCKLSVSELWRPASRLTTGARFRCRECVSMPVDIWVTSGPTVWLNGALLLTVAQNGFGIVNSGRGSRPRYAKLKMQGELLATPQPAPLSHTLWDDVSSVKTERDLKVVNYQDAAGFDNSGATLKAAEKAAATGDVPWKAPPAYHEGETKIYRLNVGYFDGHGRWQKRLRLSLPGHLC